ncbi:MAG TPA: hypothetical protein VFB23_13950 [Candidatus Acidoferrales bacterium]|nr:hypothetical protein [Candidatus Acidoferrales bacterium]
MRNRPFFSLAFSLGSLALTAAILCAATFVAAQTQSPAPAKADTKPAAKPDAKAPATKSAWVMPRTADGHPDLHGYWTSLSYTPMERPAKYGNREFLTDEETQELFNAGVKGSFDGAAGTGDAENDPTSADYDFKTYGLEPWQNGVRPNHRTSLVVDPPSGRIPPLTPAGEARRKAARGAYFTAEEGNWQGTVHADVAQDLGVGVTCVALHGGPPIIPGGYNSGLMIVQSADSIVIQTEYGSEIRVISMTGQHPAANIRQWHGDGRGHWEGDTLVVETTNFRPENVYRNANADTLKITEYFTRIDADTIEYKFTVDDPSTWTRPWSAIVPLSSVQGPLWEYACSESNNDAIQIMVGARNAEKAAAEKPSSEKKSPSGIPISQAK